MADLSDIFTGLLTAGGAAALGEGVSSDLAGAGLDQQQRLQDVARDVRGSLEFRPFTVTTGTGTGISTDPSGGFGVTLSPEEQALQQSALFGATQFLDAGQTADPALASQRERINQLFSATAGQINPDVSAATQDVFDQLQAVVAPEQQRQRLALEERLFGQGRTGVSTAAYGGTPEQLALEKAIQEQTASNALTARQQALTEQSNLFSRLGTTAGLGADLATAGTGLQAADVGLGRELLSAAFTPEQQALQALQAGTGLSGIGAELQKQAGVTEAQLASQGAEAALQGRQLGTEFDATLLANMLQSLTSPDINGDSTLGSIVGGVGGLLSNLFNSGDSGGSVDPTTQAIMDMLTPSTNISIR